VTEWFSKIVKPSYVRCSILALALIILLEEEGDGELFSALGVFPLILAAAALSISRLSVAARWHILPSPQVWKLLFAQSC
jgi:hypothetical protein